MKKVFPYMGKSYYICGVKIKKNIKDETTI